MAIAFDASSVGDGPTTGDDVLTFSHTCTGTDGFLSVFASNWFNANEVAPTMSATYNGVAMDIINSTAVGDTAGDRHRLTAFGLEAPATGANNIVITTAQAVLEIIGAANSYTGVDQTTPFDGATSTTALQSADAISLNVTSAAGDLVLGGLTGYDFGGAADGADQTPRATNDNAGATDDIFTSDEAGAASVTHSWTWSTSGADDYDAILVAFNINAAAGGATVFIKMVGNNFRLAGAGGLAS